MKLSRRRLKRPVDRTQLLSMLSFHIPLIGFVLVGSDTVSCEGFTSEWQEWKQTILHGARVVSFPLICFRD